MSIVLLKKYHIKKNKIIKKIEDIFLSIKFPAKIIGIEKNRDKNNGIKINAKGIKNLKELSKVNELAIQ